MKFTSSLCRSFFSDKDLARVVYTSTGLNTPDEEILPNLLIGTTRRNVLLKRGSSSNKGDNLGIKDEGHLKQKKKTPMFTMNILSVLKFFVQSSVNNQREEKQTIKQKNIKLSGRNQVGNF